MVNSQTVMRAQRRKKETVVDRFGGKCSICGYSKCINALEFHHVEEKHHDPSYIIMRWSWERAKEELEKCILVCSNCHREIHYKAIDVSLLRDRRSWKEKTCEYCKKEFQTIVPEQIFCSRICAAQFTNFNNRKVKNRPSKDELENLLKENNWCAIGRMFSVSDNSVRKWARAYGIIPRVKQDENNRIHRI